MATAENSVQRACLELLQYLRIHAWRSNNSPVYDARRQCFRSFVGMPGAADITGILPGGRRLEVECKSATGRQSPRQTAFQRLIVGAGGLYLLVRSVRDLEEGLRKARVIR